VHVIESGPAAGVIATAALARAIGEPNALGFDMGGTTAKASIIEGYEIKRTGEFEIGGSMSQGSRLNKGGGFLVRVPAIDIAEVGAGGGSIVHVDGARALHVGPRSAGAVPGPVCYDQGGTEVTLPDANVTLGYLHPERLPSGLRLDAQKARRAVAEQIAAPLGIDVADAAHGVYLLGCAGMARAVRAVTIERGRDPRDFTLVAFGGNGPLFAAEMARSLEIGTILVPPAPGVQRARPAGGRGGASPGPDGPPPLFGTKPSEIAVRAEMDARPRPCCAPRAAPVEIERPWISVPGATSS
jgi:N-methylhydantoinase A